MTTEITEAGRELAAELANAERRAEGREDMWLAKDFQGASDANAFARLATVHLAMRKGMERIDAIARKNNWHICDPETSEAAQIAARWRVETDPLVEAFQRMPATFDAQIWADTARKTFADLGYTLTKAQP